MWTFLFDIDGTLIHTRGAGLAAIRRAMSELFEIEEVPQVPVQGRTDFGIISDLFRPLGIDVASNIDAFKDRYWEYLPGSLAERPGVVLPGVTGLLDSLVVREDCALGILTGNTERSAHIKLQHFGLAEYFSFGGYGDEHGDRNDVAKQARKSAEAFLGNRFNSQRIWVIGDTVHDVHCARAIDSRVIAVETGGVHRDELQQSQPDIQLESLADSKTFFEIIDSQ